MTVSVTELVLLPILSKRHEQWHSSFVTRYTECFYVSDMPFFVHGCPLLRMERGANERTDRATCHRKLHDAQTERRGIHAPRTILPPS